MYATLRQPSATEQPEPTRPARHNVRATSALWAAHDPNHHFARVEPALQRAERQCVLCLDLEALQRQCCEHAFLRTSTEHVKHLPHPRWRALRVSVERNRAADRGRRYCHLMRQRSHAALANLLESAALAERSKRRRDEVE